MTGERDPLSETLSAQTTGSALPPHAALQRLPPVGTAFNLNTNLISGPNMPVVSLTCGARRQDPEEVPAVWKTRDERKGGIFCRLDVTRAGLLHQRPGENPRQK